MAIITNLFYVINIFTALSLVFRQLSSGFFVFIGKARLVLPKFPIGILGSSHFLLPTNYCYTVLIDKAVWAVTP